MIPNINIAIEMQTQLECLVHNLIHLMGRNHKLEFQRHLNKVIIKTLRLELFMINLQVNMKEVLINKEHLENKEGFMMFSKIRHKTKMAFLFQMILAMLDLRQLMFLIIVKIRIQKCIWNTINNQLYWKKTIRKQKLIWNQIQGRKEIN